MPIKCREVPVSYTHLIAMNRPMPPLIAFLMGSGIAFTIASLPPVAVRRIKIKPEIKTAAKPACQEYPYVPQIVNAKNAFKPIPGACANG